MLYRLRKEAEKASFCGDEYRPCLYVLLKDDVDEIRVAHAAHLTMPLMPSKPANFFVAKKSEKQGVSKSFECGDCFNFRLRLL